MPDWLRIAVRLDDQPLSIERGETLLFTRTLDMRHGVLHTEWVQRTPGGHEVRLRSLRLVSLSARSIGLQAVRIDVSGTAPLQLAAWLEPMAAELARVHADGDHSLWRTRFSGQFLAVEESAAAWLGGERLPAGPDEAERRSWEWEASAARPLDFVRTIAIRRSETPAHDRAPDAADPADAPALVETHRDAWEERWEASGVTVVGDEHTQLALRFATYHLVGAADPESSAASVGARGLTGDGYLGHVFWDTEIFLLPFYTLTWPEAARALLLYRHRTLPAARAKATAFGYRGALYAWESALTGEEATPPYALGPDGRVIPILCGLEEHHISADVAYAVWQYWHVTHDGTFLLDAGAEILLETARFWASRAVREADGCYHIRGVIGPDEYHETVDDNAYTNRMARWNLERGIEVAQLLQRRWPDRWEALRDAVDLEPDEPEQWRQVAAGLVTGLDPTTGLYEQFDGFFDLEDIDLKRYVGRTTAIDLMLGRERTQRSQVSKQADVLMLFALLGAEHRRADWAANFDYYEPRCGHGSSLSPPIHGLLAARLGRTELAHRYLRQTAGIDLDNAMGNAAAGVHIAALGGLWQLVVLGFGGLDIGGEQLRIAPPGLPTLWSALSYPLQWRGRRLRVDMRQDGAVAITLLRGRRLSVSISDVEHSIRPGETAVSRAGEGAPP